jgi:alpha-glucosidase
MAVLIHWISAASLRVAMTAPVRSDGRVWWREAVVYQIYTRSFADGNGDGIGDLPGITAHLDDLAGAEHALGIDAIWLCPFYFSPMVDYGYDVADHCAVDPRFGSLHDFDVLLAEAHRRGIRVLVDFIPNHTSDQHPWFEESRAGRKAEKRDWYVWSDPAPGGGRPNNWLSSFERVGRSSDRRSLNRSGVDRGDRRKSAPEWGRGH